MKHIRTRGPLVVLAGIIIFHTTGIKPAVYGEFGPSLGEYTNYIDYTDENFQAAIDDGQDVVVYVGANRCPTCSRFESSLISDIENIPSSLTILAADLDRDTDFTTTYGVRSQSTTLYFDKTGVLNTMRVGRDHGLESIVKTVASLE